VVVAVAGVKVFGVVVVVYTGVGWGDGVEEACRVLKCAVAFLFEFIVTAAEGEELETAPSQ
jgi:hypothetical protein